MNIYVASSWRNPKQPMVVKQLLGAGYSVYDFREPVPGEGGFHWSEIDGDWQNWTPEQYVNGLNHPIAEHGYDRDMDAMIWADVFVLVQPCGRSAHLELGWACGAGKETYILLEENQEPELMAKMADFICCDMKELLTMLHVRSN